MHYAPLNAAFTRRIIRYAPPSITTPSTIIPTSPPRFTIMPVPPRFTTQQLIEMRDRAAAASDEFNAAQDKEYGDGVDLELEQIAAEDNATEDAVDAGFDTTLPVTKKAPNLVPLMLTAAAAYFFL